MKVKSKALSAVLACSVTAAGTAFPSAVYAAETITQTLTVDFQELDEGPVNVTDIQAAKDGWDRIGMQSAEKGEWLVVDGALGKEEGDKSILIKSGSTTGEQALQFFPTENLKKISKGQKLTVSFDYAVCAPDKQIQAIYRGNGNSDNVYLVMNRGDGIGIGNIDRKEPQYKLKPDTWTHFEVEMTPGASSTSVVGYMNGEKVVEGEINNLTAGVFDWLYFRQYTTDPNDHFYVDNIIYTVETPLPDDYFLPEVTVSASSEEVTEAEELTVTAQTRAYSGITSVDFYVDGELTQTLTSQPYSFSCMLPVGEHEIYAAVTDLYGKKAQSSSITVISKPDSRPRISVGMEDGEMYEREQLKNVPINIEMSGAVVAKGYLNIDGEKFSDINGLNESFDLSALSIGGHSVDIYIENNLGESTSYSFSFTVLRRFEAVMTAYDYDTTFGQYVDNSNGYGRFDTLRDDFGKSMILGKSPETQTSTVNEGPWTGIDLSDIKTTAVLDFDIYMSSMRGYVFAMFITDTNQRVSIFNIQSSAISAGGGAQSQSFSAGEWHHVTVDFDMEKLLFDISVDGKKEIVDAPLNVKEGSAAGSIRLVSMMDGSAEDVYFALDNVTVKQISYAPYIYKITSPSAAGTDKVSFKDDTFTAYFSSALQEVSVFPSKFTLTCGGQSVPIISAKYNSGDTSVTFKLEKPLPADSECKLTVAENVVMGNGDLYGEKLYGGFTVIKTPFNIVSADISEDGIFTAEAENTDLVQHSVYLFINTYDENNRMLKHEVKELVLVPGKSTAEQRIEGFGACAAAEVFMWDTLNKPVCILLKSQAH